MYINMELFFPYDTQVLKESLFIAQAEHAWINFIGCLVTNNSFLLMLVREDG